jgi:hypothetical protein
MSINITDPTIERWIQDGIVNAINTMLRDKYGVGAELKKAMDKAIADSEQQIVAALKVGIAQACVSPGFLQQIEGEIARSLASQYRGAFDAVIKSAAKQAANTEVIAKRVAELTMQAAGGQP